MAVTDLLPRIPNPPAAQPGSVALGGWDAFSAPAAFRPPAGRVHAARVPLPPWVVLALGSAALSAIGLLALVLLRPFDAAPGLAAHGVTTPAAVEMTAQTADAAPADAAPADAAPADAGTADAETAGTAISGTDPTPVPADVLARLEAASNEPLHGELSQLLAAIQVGFGLKSAQVDPALRPYTVRMASRFEWNPDTFRIAVSAPSADLAAARVATLRRVFGDAVAAQRLLIEPTTGPDALTLAPR